jgi:ADP-heptose:LPS heptosyltransferase
VQRVLLIRLTALGDVILVEPVARALKEHFDGVTVDLVTEVKAAPLMSTATSIDRVVPYDRRGQDAGWTGIGRVHKRLGSTKYDLIIDLQGKLRTRILARRVSAKKRIRFQKRSFWGGLMSLLGLERPLTGVHAVDLYLELLGTLDIEPRAQARPKLALPKPKPSEGLHIGLSAGTTHSTKQWPATHFAALAQGLAAQRSQVKFTLFGGPKDREILAKIRAEYTGDNMTDLDTTGLSVEAMSEVIASLDLFVGVDSGPTHIAAALDVPVVALFGPTSPTRWGPRGTPHEAVSLAPSCSPCSNVGAATCPDAKRQHECMRNLKPESVQSAVLRVLQASSREGE